MAFVPEGQADSSQARSAWVAMERGRVPEGRSKSLSVPQIFVVATEPRHVANDSASNAHAASEMPGLPVEKFGSGNCETLTLKAPSPCCQLKLCSCRRVWRIQADDPLLASDLTKLRSVQSSRWDAAIFLMIPGTSCLATIVLSLRDKSHSPIEAPHNYLSASDSMPLGLFWRKARQPCRVSGSRFIAVDNSAGICISQNFRCAGQLLGHS